MQVIFASCVIAVFVSTVIVFVIHLATISDAGAHTTPIVVAVAFSSGRMKHGSRFKFSHKNVFKK